MVRRDRRDAAPIVDARRNEMLQQPRREIGRRLDVHVRPEQDAGGGNGPEMIVEVGFGVACHPRPRLGPEILDDDLLQVTMALVQVAQMQQGL